MIIRFFVLFTIVLIFISGNLQAQTTNICSSVLDGTQWVQTTPGRPTNIRVEPSLDGEIVQQIPENTTVRLVEGPICKDNIIWWSIATQDASLQGWMAEGTGNDYFIEPITPTHSTHYQQLGQMGLGTIDAIAWRPDGKALLVGGSRGVTYYTEELDFIGNWAIDDDIFSIAWNPDNRRFATGGGIYSHDWADGTIRVWDSFKGEVINTLLGDTPYSDSPLSSGEFVIGWDATGTQLVSIESGYSYGPLRGVRLWDAAGLRLVHQVAPISSDSDYVGFETPIALNWKRGEILFADCPNRCILNIVTGERERTLTDQSNINFFTGDWKAVTATWSLDGSRIVQSGIDTETNEYVIQMWDAVSGEPLLTIPTEIQIGASLFHDEARDAFWVMWSEDGTHILSATASGNISTWNADTGELVASVTLEGLTDPLQVLSWQPGGGKIAASDTGHTLRVWDATTGELLTIHYDHAGRSMTFAQWSPDGSRIVTSTQTRSVYSRGSRIHIWNADMGTAEVSMDGEGKVGVYWSADGTKVFSEADELPHLVWDAATGEKLATFDTSEALWQFLGEAEGSRTINGRTLYTEVNEVGLNVVGLDRISALDEQSVLQYGGPLWTVINPQGDRIAVVLHPYSSQIGIHDVKTLERLGSGWHNHVGFENTEIQWLTWLSDDNRLLSAGLDGTLRIWGQME